VRLKMAETVKLAAQYVEQVPVHCPAHVAGSS